MVIIDNLAFTSASAYYNDFWRNHVTLKTKVMMLKIQLCIKGIHYTQLEIQIQKTYFKF